MSCLFDSLSFFIRLDSFTIRQTICNYLAENKPIVDGLDTKLILDLEDSNYIRNMRNTTTWGGSNEILAACNIWKIKVNVILHHQKKKIEFIPLDGCYIKIVNIIWYGNHYEPVRMNTL